MSVNDLRIELISWITNHSDKDLLIRLKQAKDDIDFEEKSKSMIIGYRPNNAPVIKSDFLKCIQEAIKQIDNGESLNLESFEAEVEAW
ncbi:MAG: hypothetical protein AB8B53_04950 [Flavobacteriales bacterium]